MSVLEVDESNLLAGSPGGADVRVGVSSGLFGCSNNFAPFFGYGTSFMTQIVIIQLESNKSVDNQRDLKFFPLT